MTASPDSTATSSESTATQSAAGIAGVAIGRLQKLTRGRLRAAGIVIPFVVLFIALTISSSSFATKSNLLNILDQQSATLIIAAAGTLVLVAGGIDLSVGAVYGLAGVIAAQLAQHMAAGPALLVGLLVGLVVGLINGVVATFFRINALIATLAMSFVITGVGGLITHGNLVVLFDHPGFGDLARTHVVTILSSIWIMLIAVTALGCSSPARRSAATCTPPVATVRPRGSPASASTWSASSASCSVAAPPRSRVRSMPRGC